MRRPFPVPTRPTPARRDVAETYASAFVRIGTVQALENFEEFGRVGHRKTGAVVLDEADRRATLNAMANLDSGQLSTTRELDGVG